LLFLSCRFAPIFRLHSWLHHFRVIMHRSFYLSLYFPISFAPIVIVSVFKRVFKHGVGCLCRPCTEWNNNINRVVFQDLSLKSLMAINIRPYLVGTCGLRWLSLPLTF
jgi:hypothetical protein